jgi:hypothetical protein
MQVQVHGALVKREPLPIDIKNTGTSTWTNSAPDINVGVKWNTNGADWTDYHLRTDAGSVAPGSSATTRFQFRLRMLRPALLGELI